MKAESVQLLSNAGLFGPVVIVPIILQTNFGASTSLIGLIGGAYAAAGFISSYLFGRASDIRGRRGILLLGLFISGVATLLQVVSLIWGGLTFFVIVRVMIGFCAGVFSGSLLAYAYETKGKMGKFSAWGSLGWGVGNLSAGFLADSLGNEIAYVFCAVLVFASYAIALSLPFSKEVRMEVPLLPKAMIKKNAPVFSAMLIRHTGANMIWVTYPIFLENIGASESWIGVIYAVNAFGQFFFMMFLDRYDPSLLVAIGLVSSALTFFTFTLARSPWEIVPSQVILAFAWASLYVGSLRYVLDRNKEKATASGLLSSTLSLSGIIGPVLGGISATIFDFKGTIAIATIMSLVALAIFLFELRRTGEFYRLRIRSGGRT